MNTPVPTSRRRWWPWLTAILVLLVAPVVIVGVGVLSVITLDRDAALLRREVMGATNSDWHTKVQVSAGWVMLSAVRAGLHFVQHEHIDDARLALAAVRNASVGVYERDTQPVEVNLRELLARVDGVMIDRGWTRLVGVLDHGKTVLVYAANKSFSAAKLDVCVAVVDGPELVVVSTRVDAEALAKLVERHARDGYGGKLKLAKLGI